MSINYAEAPTPSPDDIDEVAMALWTYLIKSDGKCPDMKSLENALRAIFFCKTYCSDKQAVVLKKAGFSKTQWYEIKNSECFKTLQKNPILAQVRLEEGSYEIMADGLEVFAVQDPKVIRMQLKTEVGSTYRIQFQRNSTWITFPEIIEGSEGRQTRTYVAPWVVEPKLVRLVKLVPNRLKGLTNDFSDSGMFC